MVTRGLDLGGSQVRVGEKITSIDSINSTYMEISANSPVKAYITDRFSDFIIEEHPMASLVGRRFVRGEGMDHYQGNVFVCNNQTNKVEQETVYANASYALAKSLTGNYHAGDEVSLGVCIPTSEFYSDKKDYPELFKNCMAGTHTVFFPIANRRISFVVSRDYLKVFPEGVVAAFRFKTDMSFVSGISLIVDVGYRSTDITILRRFKPVGKSAVSRPIGGINIEAGILAELERNNILVSREDVQTALCRRYLFHNGVYEDITDIIRKFISYPDDVRRDSALAALGERGISTTAEALATAERSSYINHENAMLDITAEVTEIKRAFVSNVRTSIIDVLATQMLNLASVNNIMPIGRPFEGGLAVDNSLASILCEELGSKLRYYSVPDLGTANIEGILGVIGKNADTV